MVNCPSCDAPIDVDEDELDEGDVVECDECGSALTVTGVDPLELEADDEEEEDEDEDYDEDDEEEEEEDDKDDNW